MSLGLNFIMGLGLSFIGVIGLYSLIMLFRRFVVSAKSWTLSIRYERAGDFHGPPGARCHRAGSGPLLLSPWAGLCIGLIAEYHPSHMYASARELGFIHGPALGCMSCAIRVLSLALVIVIAHALVGMCGMDLGAPRMLSTWSLGLTVNAYLPISDHACGLAEMVELPPMVRTFTGALGVAGHTAAAKGKGPLSAAQRARHLRSSAASGCVQASSSRAPPRPAPSLASLSVPCCL